MSKFSDWRTRQNKSNRVDSKNVNRKMFMTNKVDYEIVNFTLRFRYKESSTLQKKENFMLLTETVSRQVMLHEIRQGVGRDIWQKIN